MQRPEFLSRALSVVRWAPSPDAAGGEFTRWELSITCSFLHRCHPVSHTELLFIPQSLRDKTIQWEAGINPDIMEMFRRHLHVEQLDWKIKHSHNGFKIMAGKWTFHDDGSKSGQVCEASGSVMHL